MFTEKDREQFAAKGIQPAQVERQIQQFKEGFPFMDILRPATVGDGVIRLSPERVEQLAQAYPAMIEGKKVVKFVPASGAASRMFKDLFSFVDDAAAADIATLDELKQKGYKFIHKFFSEIEHFAFYNALADKMKEHGLDIRTAPYRQTLQTLLSDQGLGYGNLPKGLLLFHKHEGQARTSTEEHLVEAASYTQVDDRSYLHFTVSPEHRAAFERHIGQASPEISTLYTTSFEVGFSEQHPATDTVAVDMQNEPFRNSDGSILFRPGGHGALIENLNHIDADLVFIKNIDNVAPERLRADTLTYKRALGALLLDYQSRLFALRQQLDADLSPASLAEVEAFLRDELCLGFPEGFEQRTEAEKIIYYKRKLDRPMRVCGMVRNEGEPGGGPFHATDPDGSSSLQVVESSQIDPNDAQKAAIVAAATHFNPVDLVCATKDAKGRRYNLTNFRDEQTGFISEKSKDGKDLKALELPGLWNGAMSDWNTFFVEVPISTFSPVKTVNDLLRDQHQ